MDVEAVTEQQVHISMDLVAAPPGVVPGQIVGEGRYQVGERIGGGGMADVYSGRDLLLLRDVALKVLKPGMASTEMFARMLQEARAAAAIDHPHLLRVTDAGRVGVSMFLVTDLLRGSSLAELLRIVPGGRLDWPQAIRLLLPALEALHRAHACGIIHRDIKPDNLFMHRRDEVDGLVVLDLGIAKVAVALRTADGPALTETGRVIGTPAYMSPEQAGSLPLTHATDIYSVAVTLYRMIAGRLPFVAAPGDQPYMLMARHIYDVPPLLSKLVPGVPGALDRLMARALAKAPGRRPATMRAFAAALRECLPHEVPAAPSPAPFERSGRFHRVGRLSGSVVVTLALLGFHGPAQPAEDAAEVERAGELGEATEVGASGMAGERPPARVASGEADVRAEAGDAGTELCEAAPSGREEAVADEPAPSSQVRAATRVSGPRGRPPRGPAATGPVFGGAVAAMATCIRKHGGVALRAVAVRVHVRPDGRVGQVVVPGHETSLLGDCAVVALGGLRFAPGPAQVLARRFMRETEG